MTYINEYINDNENFFKVITSSLALLLSHTIQLWEKVYNSQQKVSHLYIDNNAWCW